MLFSQGGDGELFELTSVDPAVNISSSSGISTGWDAMGLV
jgi:hypothetical protein